MITIDIAKTKVRNLQTMILINPFPYQMPWDIVIMALERWIGENKPPIQKNIPHGGFSNISTFL